MLMNERRCSCATQVLVGPHTNDSTVLPYVRWICGGMLPTVHSSCSSPNCSCSSIYLISGKPLLGSRHSLVSHVLSTPCSEEDPELKAEAQSLQAAMPFAAMGAEGLVDKNGTQVCSYFI